jgi:hypothetical protein
MKGVGALYNSVDKKKFILLSPSYGRKVWDTFFHMTSPYEMALQKDIYQMSLEEAHGLIMSLEPGIRMRAKMFQVEAREYTNWAVKSGIVEINHFAEIDDEWIEQFPMDDEIEKEIVMAFLREQEKEKDKDGV